MIIIHKYSQAYYHILKQSHRYMQVSDTSDGSSIILDCNPWLWYKGCATGKMMEVMSTLRPDYVILPNSYDLDTLAFSDFGCSKIIANAYNSNYRKLFDSYYVDVLLVEDVALLDKISKEKIQKPVWLNVTYSHKNVMGAAMKANCYDFVTHILSDAVFVFSSMGIVFHNTRGVSISVSDYWTEGSDGYKTIHVYNALLFESWCNGLGGITFDEFLKGGY